MSVRLASLSVARMHNKDEMMMIFKLFCSNGVACISWFQHKQIAKSLDVPSYSLINKFIKYNLPQAETRILIEHRM
jgi:hypothetical protein